MENKKNYGYIYLITNLINGKQYIGQTVQTIKERFYGHISKKNPVISKAIKKHGRKNFKIEEIDVAYNQKELDLIEGVYISWFKTLAPNGYNITKIINGRGKHSEKTIEKIKTKSNTLERLKKSSEYGKKSRGISYKNFGSNMLGFLLVVKNIKLVLVIYVNIFVLAFMILKLTRQKRMI
jgi:group I intron endonuclease